jgi:hypothetical protein
MKNLSKRLIRIISVAVIVVAFTTVVNASNITATILSADGALTALENELIFNAQTAYETELISEIIDIYRTDEMFELHFNSNSTDAINMVRSVICSFLSQSNMASIQSYLPTADYYFAPNVPTYSQSQTNSCGAASALQTIISLGGSVPGNTMTAKEQTLISQTGLGAGTQSSVFVYEVVGLVENYTNADYAYLEMTSQSSSTLDSILKSSLSLDGPVVFHAIPKYIAGYYPSTATGGHYITAYGYIPANSGTVNVNDCHYSSSYNGTHSVPFAQMYNSIHSQSGRYIIYRVS